MGKDKQPERFWDWQSAALVVILIQIAALRLEFTGWTQSLSVAQTMGLLGALLGLALGHTVLYPRTVRMFGIAYGLMVIPAQLLFVTGRAYELYLDLDIILLRLYDAVALLFQSQPVYDPLFFITIAAVGFWGMGVSAGYQLTRRQDFLRIALPAGIIMLLIQVYDPWAAMRVWLMAAYIFAALILLGRLYFLQSKNGWKTKHVFFTSEVEGDVARVALTFAAVVIFIAWMFPNALSSIGPAAKAWSKFTKPMRDRFSDAVSALESPYRAPSADDFYGAELKLGSNAPTSDTPVLYFKVDRVAVKPARYYWRGRVYDRYLNGQWSNSEKPMEDNFDPELDLLQPNNPATRAEASFTVTLNFPKQELMYAPAEIVWVNRPSRMLYFRNEDADFDITAWMASSKLSAGEQYKVRAQIVNPSIEELRAAGEDYPQWVKDRYLQIPPAIAPQLKELAERVTESQPTPYDQAQAITAFLRNEITYANRLRTSPPEEQDPMMWVLFEYKKGFCMYSASAEVLMLRSLGIPARMAVGFAQGEYDSTRRRYVVARMDAHAWPEVYFPNIGWVEFEPTGNQDPLERPRQPVLPVAKSESNNAITPQKEPLADLMEEESAPSANKNSSFTFARLMPYLLPALLLAFFAFGVFLVQRYSIIDRLPVYLEGRYIQRGQKAPGWLTIWSKWAKLTPIERAFHPIDLSLRWLGQPQPAHTTPLARAGALTGLLPSVQADITALKEEHEASLFTNRAGNLERARRAGRRILLEAFRVRLRKSFSYR